MLQLEKDCTTAKHNDTVIVQDSQISENLIN